ncbi:hypothetical protein ACLOJK_025647 [Asimina triloba]
MADFCRFCCWFRPAITVVLMVGVGSSDFGDRPARIFAYEVPLATACFGGFLAGLGVSWLEKMVEDVAGSWVLPYRVLVGAAEDVLRPDLRNGSGGRDGFSINGVLLSKSDGRSNLVRRQRNFGLHGVAVQMVGTDLPSDGCRRAGFSRQPWLLDWEDDLFSMVFWRHIEFRVHFW